LSALIAARLLVRAQAGAVQADVSPASSAASLSPGETGEVPRSGRIVVGVTAALREINQKSLVLEGGGNPPLSFRVSRQTAFYKDGKESDATGFEAGDYVSVQGTQDKEGVAHADRVIWQSAGRRQVGSGQGATVVTPGKVDLDDPGPAAMGGRAASEAVGGSKESNVAGTALGSAQAVPVADDRYIARAREIAADFLRGLPPFVCTEYISFYTSSSSPAEWRAQDVVSVEAIHEAGMDSYRNMAVNGKVTGKAISELGTVWSSGEFGTLIRDLFSIATDASFRLLRQASTSGKNTRVYGFSVDEKRSKWQLQLGLQTLKPAYDGTVWIDPLTGGVLRLELQARAIPRSFPFDTLETTVDYGRVSISGKEYVLPVRAERLSCRRGAGECIRSEAEFRNYRRFEPNSSLRFY
jgi:hypothetical protein